MGPDEQLTDELRDFVSSDPDAAMITNRRDGSMHTARIESRSSMAEYGVRRTRAHADAPSPTRPPLFALPRWCAGPDWPYPGIGDPRPKGLAWREEMGARGNPLRVAPMWCARRRGAADGSNGNRTVDWT
jgi:hypothetical protein